MDENNIRVQLLNTVNERARAGRSFSRISVAGDEQKGETAVKVPV